MLGLLFWLLLPRALALNKVDIGSVNICSRKPIPIRDLVERWIDENGWQIELNLGYYPYLDYEPLAFLVDCGKLTNFIASKCAMIAEIVSANRSVVHEVASCLIQKTGAYMDAEAKHIVSILGVRRHCECMSEGLRLSEYFIVGSIKCP